MVSPKDIGARLANLVHGTIFNSTKGRIGGSGFGMPVVQLTTTGRKSGQARKSMLTSPVQDGDRMVLVASYGGADHHPAWYLNLRDNPDVEITRDGKTTAMKARTATAEERAELWPRVVSAYKGYAGYQTRTDREIPLVILEPA
jgi:deazaflavin-dependent oxidoreductase (nitroreductase family)